MICPARASSTNPIALASDVFLITCTLKPTVGGVAIRTACGRITVDHALRPAQRQALRRLPLRARHRLDAPAPDLAEEGADIDGERGRRRRQRRPSRRRSRQGRSSSGTTAPATACPARAGCKPGARSAPPGCPKRGTAPQEPGSPAAAERHQRQHHRPPRALQQELQMVGVDLRGRHATASQRGAETPPARKQRLSQPPEQGTHQQRQQQVDDRGHEYKSRTPGRCRTG